MGWGGPRKGAGRPRLCDCGKCKLCKERIYSLRYYRKVKGLEVPDLPIDTKTYEPRQESEVREIMESEKFVKGRFYEWDRTRER